MGVTHSNPHLDSNLGNQHYYQIFIQDKCKFVNISCQFHVKLSWISVLPKLGFYNLLESTLFKDSNIPYYILYEYVNTHPCSFLILINMNTKFKRI